MMKLRRRAGALALTLSMCVSLVLGNVPALAAGGTTPPTTYTKPELVMDFLGDNKVGVTSYYDKTHNSGGGLGNGNLPTPATEDQAWKSTADDGTKWNGYVQADASPNHGLADGTQTIFWMGIGIKNIDQFVLSNDKGIYSAEVALYYNPAYVQPYEPTDPGKSFRTCIEEHMLGPNGLNQWSSADYQVVRALTKQMPLLDPNDTGALGDFVTPTQGYGTDELIDQKFPGTTQDAMQEMENHNWRMAYVSVEMKAEALNRAARFKGTGHSASTTYYIAMVPFVLRDYDPDNKLCIRLARNASAFTIGSKKADGVGSYGDGDVTYGNWDKYTYHDPQHDLKLMFDYTGDLNIFTNKREDGWHEAILEIESNPANAGNQAKLIINNEPLSPPSQIADAHGEKIQRLTGGEQMRVSVKKASGYMVTVTVTDESNNSVTITPIVTPVSPWEDEWTFIMPTGTDVHVKVQFDGNPTPDAQYKATLHVIDNNHNQPNNTGKLTAPGGLTTQAIATGTDVLNGVTKGTRVTVTVTRNSDFAVAVRARRVSDGATISVSNIVTQDELLTYTFEMPESDVEVEVEFTLAPTYQATLAVEGTVDSAHRAANWAQMSYSDSQGNTQSCGQVSFANANDGPSTIPGLKNNQIETTAGRTVTIKTHCSPEYQVSGIVFRDGSNALLTGVTASAGTTAGEYTFSMPAQDVKVIVSYEKVKTYRARLILNTASALSGEGARLTGVDARVAGATPPYYEVALERDQYVNYVYNLTLDTHNYMDVFANAAMGVSFFHDDGAGNTHAAGLAAGRTATIKVYYPNYPEGATGNDILIPTGSAGSGYNFNMKKLNYPADDATHNEAVYVEVTFDNAVGNRLTAYIHETHVDTNDGDAKWAGAGHKNPIAAYENDQLDVKIEVRPGYYIADVEVCEGGPTPGAPMGIPVNLTGIGYNNGQGGTETASFTMPNTDATLKIVYKKGPPKEEPEDLKATVRKAGNGTGIVHIKNETTGNLDTNPAGNGYWVDADAGDTITATYEATNGSYISGITVTTNVPGTAVSWNYNPPTIPISWHATADGSLEVTMPAANVTVTVTFTTPDASDTPFNLTLAKTEPTSEPNNVVSITTSGGSARVPINSAVPTSTTQAYRTELNTAVINVAAGWHIVSAELTETGGTNTAPVTLSGSGYNGGVGGTETATFQMPAWDATLTVTFATGAPANTITLKVDDPDNKPGNTATLYLDGTQMPPAATQGADRQETAPAGTAVKVSITEEAGYGVDLPILTTPNGVVNVTWTDTDTFEFVMPAEPLTVTVPFRTDGVANNEFYANLIFRDGDGQSAAGVAAAKGTFLTGTFSNSTYANQLDGTLLYSRTAQAGESIPFAVRIPDRYYISRITVTPASFGVTPNITGMIGTQQGDFRMPAGNVLVNVYLSKGWPDQVKYRVTLHVDAPNGATTPYSSATLANLTTPAVTPDVPAVGQISGSDVLTALDGEKMRVTLRPDPTHILDSLTVVDGNNGQVSYQWATDGSDLAVDFSVPGSSVDVYVKFREKTGSEPTHTVTLHTAGNAAAATTVGMTKNGTSQTSPFQAAAGDNIGLTVSGASTTLITYAYATTSDGDYVSLGNTLAGLFADAAAGPYGFVMPVGVDVDVYLGFQTVTPPTADQFPLTLQVNGPDNGCGSVTVNEYAPGSVVSAGSMSATAVGGNAMLAHKDYKITAKITIAQPTQYALYSIIAYTAAGDRVVVSLDHGDPTWKTYTFTMPADTTHIEVEFRKVEPFAYQIQVVVNNTVNNGQGNNDAFLYSPVGNTQDGFKFRSGVSAGTTFDLGIIVDTGYQVQSILAVPQGSGVAANIPLPATSSDRTQVQMPASDLVIYVTFTMDNTTRYNVLGSISYPAGVSAPDQATEHTNKVELIGSEGQNDLVESDDVTNITLTDRAMIQEAQGKRVDVKWTCATNYVVDSYTATTTSGQVVLCQPNADNTGFFFIMPAAPVEVNVVFTKPSVAPPRELKAKLHYVNSPAGAGDQAKIEEHGSNPSNFVDTDGGVLSGLQVGDLIDISATPGSGRYLQTIYVLQNGLTMAQNGQNIPLHTSNLDTVNPNTLSTGDFYMPSGNVDVYVVFSATQPAPNSHMAVVKVNAGGTTPDHSSYAEIYTSTANTATAYCDDAPAGIVAVTGDTVTVKITVDTTKYVLDSVTGTPITPIMQPQLNPNGSTTYTFIMPNNDASVIVNLKKKEAAKYKLYLHVLNQVETTPGELDEDNETILSYSSPVTGSLTHTGAAPKQSNPAIPYLETPAGSEVTLAVEPETGYYVQAAYVVYQNGLVTMTPATLPAGYGRNRTPIGLEGTTPLDVGDPSADAGKNINTATFTMPSGTADVYVVYKKGTVPTTPWYNLVVIATDSGGATANTGASEVGVSSATAGPGSAAIASEVLVPSNGVATYFYSVPHQETIHLDASDIHAAQGYQYDTVTGMQLTYQAPTPGVAANPGIHPVDTTNHPRGDVQEFGMPQSNVGVHINFTTTGTTGLWAQLHVVLAAGVPGWSSNTVTMSTGTHGANDYQEVDNHELTHPGGDPNYAETTNNMKLTDLTAHDLISTLIHPRDSSTRVVQVTVTQVDAAGNTIGTVLATHAGDPSDSAQDRYNYIMGDYSVHVYVVLAKKNDTDRFVAVAAPVYHNSVTATTGGTGTERNEITGVTNMTTSGLNHADYWTEIKGADTVRVNYTAQTGVYVEVKAYRAGTATAVPLVQFGVGNGTAGFAYVNTPDPGCDVEIQVIFSTDPPTPKDLTFNSADHGGMAANVSKLDIARPAPVPPDVRTWITLTPTASNTATFGVTLNATSGTNHANEQVTPGTGLTVSIPSPGPEPGYEIKQVEVKVGSAIATFYMEPDNSPTPQLILVDANGDPVNLQMPTGNATITVYFKKSSNGLLPYDPDQKAQSGTTTLYDEYNWWIKAENRGDYLVVTVPLLNKENEQSPTSVTWTDAKKDRFKFYLDETASGATTPVRTDLGKVIELTRPDDAPATTGTEPYWLNNFAGTHYNPQTYIGAQFILKVRSDADIDNDTSIVGTANKASAKALAAILRGIMDNDGTKKGADEKYSLYISCEETTYKADGTVEDTVEGGQVDFEVPRYYSLVGQLESYAPAHIATFTLADTAVGSKISFTSELQGTNGVDLWRQDFKIKLTSDFDDKLSGKNFTLTIEKAGHITYTRTAITLDTSQTAITAGEYDASTLEFKIQDPIHLFCGDIDSNGDISETDVGNLIAMIYGAYPVTTTTNKTDADWVFSIYNPDSFGYAGNLNGDDAVDMLDMNIILDPDNYNRRTADYGAPTGLQMLPMMLTAVKLPDWYIEMMMEGKDVPKWAAETVENGKELPEWAVECIRSGMEIPDWAVERVKADKVVPEWAVACIRSTTVVPDWAVECLETGTELPAWASARLVAGEEIPDWAIDLVRTGTTLLDWSMTQLNAGEDLPEWVVEQVKNETTIVDWANEQAAAGVELPAWAAELVTPTVVPPEPLPPVTVPPAGENLLPVTTPPAGENLLPEQTALPEGAQPPAEAQSPTGTAPSAEAQKPSENETVTDVVTNQSGETQVTPPAAPEVGGDQQQPAPTPAEGVDPDVKLDEGQKKEEPDPAPGKEEQKEEEPEPDAAPSEKEEEPKPDAAPSEKEEEPKPDAAPSEKEEEPKPDAAPSEKEEEPKSDAAPSEEEEEPKPDAAPSEEKEEPAPDATPSEKEEEAAPDAAPSEKEEEAEPDAAPSEKEEEAEPDAAPSEKEEEPKEPEEIPDEPAEAAPADQDSQEDTGALEDKNEESAESPEAMGNSGDEDILSTL